MKKLSTITCVLLLLANFVGPVAAANRVTSVNNYKVIKPGDSAVGGQRKAYNRSSYTLVGNLLPNSNFLNSTKGYTPSSLTDNNGNPLYRVVTHNNKNWLRIDDGTVGDPTKQGMMSAVVNVPPQSRNSLIEVSFLVCGYYTCIRINNQDYGTLNVQIDPDKPERLYYYFNPHGAATFTLKLCRAFSNNLIPGTFVDYADILVKEATPKYISIPNLPASGTNLQLAKFMNNGTQANQEKLLAEYKKLGGMIRLWVCGDLFASYVAKKPAKRTNLASRYLSANYVNLQVEKVPTGLDPAKARYLDWFFNKCQQYGLELSVCLGNGFTDSQGNPHATLSTPGTYEFLDSDQDMRDGFIKLFSDLVSRYKSYNNIVGWEFINEGFGTWAYSYAGINSSTPNYLRSCLFRGYRSFERQAYKTIKAIDPVHPIIFNGGSPNITDLNYLDADDVCDWVCPSFYPGAIFIDQSGIANGNTFTPNRGYGQILSTSKDGFSLIVKANKGAQLPSGLINGQKYYMTNVTAYNFQLASTIGGQPISVQGGSGTFSLYSDDGKGVEFSDYLLERLSYDPKFVFFSEFGAYDYDDLKLWRNDDIDPKYIGEVNKKIKKYGVATLITYDEGSLMFNSSGTNLTKSGRALSNTTK